MAITQYLKQILSARYGRDVRQAIHDGIQQCYYDGKAGSIDLEARQSVEVLNGDVADLQEANNTMSESIHVLENDVADLQDAIITTTETTLSNSHAGRFKFDEIGGVMEQDSTEGNQLFDGINQGNYLSADTKNGGTTDTDTGFTINVNGGVYTVSSTTTQERFRVACSNSIGTTFTCSNGVNKDNQSGTITIDCTGYSYLVVNATDLSAIMLNAGNTALPYEKYTGGNPAPNPSYPMEIKNSVVSGVRTHGKNFFNVNDVDSNSENNITATDNGISITSIASTWYSYFMYSKQLLPNTKYTISADVQSSDVSPLRRIIVTDSSGNNLNVHHLDANGHLSVTFTTTDGNVIFKFGTNNEAGGTVINYNNIMLNEGNELPYEPYTSSEITFSQPIDLYGKDNVQDVITANGINRKYATKQITSVIDFDSSGKLFYIGNFADIIYDGTDGLPPDILCDSYITYELNTARTVDYGFTQYGKGLYIANKDWNYNLDTANTALASNPITVVYKLETPTTEALPIADQIGLNSLATYDGITYVEFIYEGPQPTLKGEYGTSKVGGYTLESLLVARNNDIRLTALETA